MMGTPASNCSTASYQSRWNIPERVSRARNLGPLSIEVSLLEHYATCPWIDPSVEVRRSYGTLILSTVLHYDVGGNICQISYVNLVAEPKLRLMQVQHLGVEEPKGSSKLGIYRRRAFGVAN